jgi:anti-anti-sigma factor
MSFSYTKEVRANICIYAFQGRILDKEECKELMNDFESQLDSDITNFIISLESMDYMNSSGLGILINILTKSRNKYGELVVCCIPEKINKLLITSKLNNIFNSVDSLDEAIKKLEKPNK